MTGAFQGSSYRTTLRDFASNGVLETREQAVDLIAAIGRAGQSWTILDFSGLTGLTRAFELEFFQRAACDLAQVWLVPRDYGADMQPLVNGLLNRLAHQRACRWRVACEKFAGNDRAEQAQC